MIVSRRNVLAASGAALVAAPAFATEMIKDRTAGWTVINALGGIEDPNFPPAGPGEITPRMLADARASGLTAVNVTIGYVFGQEEPFEATVADVALIEHAVNVCGEDHLARLLAERGFTSGRIEKILDANFVRFAREVW